MQARSWKVMKVVLGKGNLMILVMSPPKEHLIEVSFAV